MGVRARFFVEAFASRCTLTFEPSFSTLFGEKLMKGVVLRNGFTFY